MDGFAVGGHCYRSALEASGAYCASVGGVTSAGVVSCQSPVIVGSVLTYTLQSDAAKRTTRPVSVTLPKCEPFDLQQTAPVVSAWFVALVVILCARSVYTKVFNRERV